MPRGDVLEFPALMSAKEAAAYLGICRMTLHRMRNAKEVRAVQLRPGLRRYRRADLDRLIELKTAK